MNIVRIDKQDGSTRPSDRAEVERIALLNYQNPALAMELFDEGERIQSPFAWYEILKNAEMPQIKAVLIDAVAKTVETVEIEPTYDSFCQLLKWERIVFGDTLPNGDILYVADEPSWRETSAHAFQLTEDGPTFGERGLIVGYDLGTEVDHELKTRADDLRVHFCEVEVA